MWFRPPTQKRIYSKSCGTWSQNLTRHFAISGGFPATIPTKNWLDNNQEVWHQPFWKPYRLLGQHQEDSPYKLFQRQQIVTKSVTNPKYEAKENLDHLPVAMCLFSTLLMASSRSISTNLCNKPNYRRQPIWAYVMTPVPLRATISQPNTISWLQNSHTSWGKVIWWSPNPLFYAKMKWITSSRVILEPL